MIRDDAVSGKLARFCAQGTNIMEVFSDNGKLVNKTLMSDVLIASYQNSRDGDGTVDTVSLSFVKVEFKVGNLQQVKNSGGWL